MVCFMSGRVDARLEGITLRFHVVPFETIHFPALYAFGSLHGAPGFQS